MSTRTPMSVQDALWLTTDRPNNLMIIDGVMIMATNPGYDAVLDVARTRIIGRFPVYQRKAVRSGGGWAWIDDPGFELTRHVKRVRLPRPGNISALQGFMSEQRAKSLPRTRPLWVMFLVEGVHLQDGTIGSAVVIRTHHAIADGVRLTQVMLSMCDTDAAAVEAVVSRPSSTQSPSWLPIPLPAPVAAGMEAVIETTRDSAADTIQTVGNRLRGVMNAAGDAAVMVASTVADAVAGSVGRVISDPIGTAIETASGLPGALANAPAAGLERLRAGAHSVRDNLHPRRLPDTVRLFGGEDNRVVNDIASITKITLSDNPETVWSGELGVSKTIAWSAPISLADVKAISRSQGATINDVLLAAVAGGLRRYLGLHGGGVREIQWMVPVNLKPFADNLPADLGNYFALVILPMPLGPANPQERIRQMKSQMARIKNSDEAVITFTLQQVMSKSPAQVQLQLTNFFAGKAVGVLTNVPGPRGLLRFGGSPVVQIIGFAPCSGDQPMTATIFSYNGTVTIGFATDTGLVPDPEVLVGFVMQEAAAMRSLVAETRRVPESQRPAPTAIAAGPPKPRPKNRRAAPTVS